VAPRAYWKGYLKLSLVSCPVALFPASSEREKISFTLMRYSISRSCFNEAISTRRRRSIGGTISPMMVSPNGQRGRGGP